jgi:transposase
VPLRAKATDDYDIETRRLVREAYAARKETLAEIARRYGVSIGTLHRWREAEQWPARSHRPAAGAVTHGDAAARKRRRRTDLELTERLRELIRRALDQLEMTMTTNDRPEALGLERETRAIGTLIKNLEKVTKLETDWSRDGNVDKPGNASGPERVPGIYDNEQAEQKRRALVERLEKVRERYRQSAVRNGERT